MARKAVKKAVKRAAPVKKLYAVAWANVDWDHKNPEFLTGIHDTIQKAKDEADESCDSGDTFFIYEVKLVAQSEPAGKLNWKSK
jgi:hypothetical protein